MSILKKKQSKFNFNTGDKITRKLSNDPTVYTVGAFLDGQYSIFWEQRGVRHQVRMKPHELDDTKWIKMKK